MTADSFAQLPDWHGALDLVREFPVGVFARPDQQKLIEAVTSQGKIGNELCKLHIAQPTDMPTAIGWAVVRHDYSDMSSDTIRKFICNNQIPDGIAPDVLAYIKNHKLYLKDNWYVPAIVEDEVEALAIQANIRPTLYDLNNIYTDSDENVFETYKTLIRYTGETIRDVVALRPARAALHALIVALSTQFQTHDHEDLQLKTENLLEHEVQPLLHAAARHFDGIETQAKQTAKQYQLDGGFG